MSIPVGSIFDCDNMFFKDKGSYISDATYKKYSSDIADFESWLSHTDFDMIHFNEQTLIDGAVFNPYLEYILHLRDKGVRPVSIRSYCRSVKVFLKWCYEHDMCPDYVKGVKLPADDSSVKMPLSSSEVAVIDGLFKTSCADGLRDWVCFHLMLDCGLRRQEVLHLQISDLCDTLSGFILNINCSKGNKSRFVLCPDFVVDNMRSYWSKLGLRSGFALRSQKDLDSPMSECAVKNLFGKIKEASHIDRVHPHLLRHTFATSYLIGGGNLEFLRVFLGHADYDVTRVYMDQSAKMKMLGVDVYHLDPVFFQFGY